MNLKLPYKIMIINLKRHIKTENRKTVQPRLSNKHQIKHFKIKHFYPKQLKTAYNIGINDFEDTEHQALKDIDP